MKQSYKIIAAPVIAVLLFVSCNQASSPSPAEAPRDGSIFTYHLTGDSSGVSFTGDPSDTVRRTGEGFIVDHGTVTPDQFKLRDNGDIELAECCDWLPFGVASHGAFQTKEVSSPTKHDGFEYKGYLRFTSEYLGSERIAAAGVNYDCAKIKVEVKVREEGGDGNGKNYTPAVWTYWYSSQLHYFARIDQTISVFDSAIISSSQVLTSVR